MTWEIVAGIIALAGFIIGIMTPIIKLNTAITSLKCSIDALRTDLLRSDKRIDAHSLKLDDHEKRIIKLEDEKEIEK